MVSSLTVLWADGTRTILLDRLLSIGRSADCDIVIDGEDVSRHHATLRPGASGGAVLCDLGALNGTTVNGVRLAANESVAVSPGDNIQIASALILLVAVDEPALQVEPAVAPAADDGTPHAGPIRRPDSQQERGRHPVRRNVILTLGSLGFVFAFVIYLSATAVDNQLLVPSYYKGVLNDSNAYHRVYTEVAPDPALSDEVSSLVGGIPIPLAGIASAVEQVAPSFLLEQAVEASIDRLIAYLKNHESLDVAIDVTPIVGIGNISGVTDLINGLIDGEGSAKGRVQGEFIHEVTVNGVTRSYLGPPPEVTRDVSQVIWIVHLVSWAAGWIRIAAVVAGLAVLVLMVRVAGNGVRGALRWTGVPLSVAGIAGFAGWWVVRGIARDRITHATLGDKSHLPPAFQRLVRDVLQTASDNLTPTIWGPSIAAGMAGGLLVVGSIWLTRRSRAAVAREAAV